MAIRAHENSIAARRLHPRSCPTAPSLSIFCCPKSWENPLDEGATPPYPLRHMRKHFVFTLLAAVLYLSAAMVFSQTRGAQAPARGAAAAPAAASADWPTFGGDTTGTNAN